MHSGGLKCKTFSTVLLKIHNFISTGDIYVKLTGLEKHIKALVKNKQTKKNCKQSTLTHMAQSKAKILFPLINFELFQVVSNRNPAPI